MGVLFSAKQVFINPESFTFLESIGVLAMVILGGMGSIPGAVLGAAVVTVLNLQVLKGLSLWLNELQERRRHRVRLQPRQPAHPARAGQVRAHGLRHDPRADDDLPPAGHPPRAAPPAGAGRRGATLAVGGDGHAALFEARAVTKRFGGLTARQPVDFALDAGIASIIGPNGAGKTTLFNVFTGIYAPEEGAVTFRGHPLLGLRPDQITALGICRTFQNIRLFANMTAIENVLVGMHARIPLRLWDVLSRSPRFAPSGARRLAARAAELLERVGLRGQANEVARNLPYGDQRRLELAPRAGLRARRCCSSTSPPPA